MHATLDFPTNEEKAGDTQDSTDRKEARDHEVDGWSIRLPGLMLQLKLLKKLYAKAKHWKRMSAVFVYAQIVLAPKVGRKEKRERVRGGKSLQGTLLNILLNRTIRSMRWLELLGFSGQMTPSFLFSFFFFISIGVFPLLLPPPVSKENFSDIKSKWDEHKPHECFHRDRKQRIGAG